jgi:Cu-Zn family superoxide dismutase
MSAAPMQETTLQTSMFLAVSAALSLAGCAAMHGHSSGSATADLKPTTGSSATGKVVFEQRGDTIIVRADIAGLKSGQAHGFHIHEKGDCSSGDGMSAGGHFNPTGQPHGPQDAAHHAGDLPSLQADAGGRAQTTFSVRGLTVGSGPTDIVGKGLIVHAQPDDYRTQPTGNAGGRIACAVIVKAA